MTNQQIRTITQQSDKASRQPKPKPAATTAAVESEALQRALNDPLNASVQAVLVAQKRAGNRAASQLVQAKLTVGAASDQYEQEADRVAEQVVNAPAETGLGETAVQRSEEEEELQRLPVNRTTGAAAPPLVQRVEGPNAAHEIKGEDIEYEIVAHRLAYQDSIAAGAKQWLDSRGYQQEWHKRVVGPGLAVGLLLPQEGAKRRAILAFKGTSPEKAGDVLADLDPIAVGFTAFKQRQAQVGELMQIGCAASAACGAGHQVDVVGHSLGGALAQHAASAFPANVKRIVTFQAPGISTIQANMFKGTQDVTHHIAAGDIVDLAGGKHLPGDVFFHDVEGLGSTHTQYLLNSAAFKSQREAVGLTDDVLQDLGIADKLAEHSGHVSKTAGYPFRVRQFAVERAREAASPLGSLAVGGLSATKGLISGAKSAWHGGGDLANSAWQGTRSWGRDQQGQNKPGVGNWFKRLGGNILGGLGVAGGRVLGGLGAAGAGAGALVTGTGTLASGLGALGMGLGGLAVGGVLGAGKWAGEKLGSGIQKGASAVGQLGQSAGRGLMQLGAFLNPFKKKQETTEDYE